MATILMSAVVAQAQEDPLTKQFEMQRKQREQMVARLPLLDKHHFDELFSLRQNKGFIELLTPLASTRGMKRVEIENLPGTSTLNIDGGADGVPGTLVVPVSFQFSCIDYTGGMHSLTVSWQGNYFQVLRQDQTSKGFNNSLLLQMRQPNGAKGFPGQPQSQVTLKGNVADVRGRGTNIIAQAETFELLCSQYASEVRQVVRPMMLELGQEELFAPDPQTAWQLFIDDCKPEPALQQEVVKRLADLDAEDFRVRERAVEELRKLGRGVAVVARQISRDNLSYEQCMRLDMLVSSFVTIEPRELQQMRNSPDILLECLLYCADEAVRTSALRRLEKVANKPITFDLAVSGPERTRAIKALRDELAGKPATRP